MLFVANATNMVNGLNPTNELNDSTVIDVEPTTGKSNPFFYLYFIYLS